ncbi:MAG: nucleotidyltransferase domain-containing protein [Campylobacterales bacterium]|nr:nucleotidyltransferase domain-containing protein [Campylobacterales bacterium]
MKKQLKDLLKNNTLVSFAYLFGSYARGDAIERSDVDVAVYLVDPSFDNRLRIHHDLAAALNKEVDVVVLNDVKNMYLLKDILDEGVVVKESDERDFFEVKKYHEILDFLAFKRLYDVA